MDLSYERLDPSESQLAEIADLYVRCFNAPDKGEDWTQESSIAYFIDRKNEGSHFYLAMDKSQIVGVVCGSDFARSFISKEFEKEYERCFYISLVAVDEKYRRQKVADHLMQLCEKDLFACDYKTISVRCRASNQPIQNLFAKFGFSETHRYNSSLGGVTCERVMLEKPIAD